MFTFFVGKQEREDQGDILDLSFLTRLSFLNPLQHLQFVCSKGQCSNLAQQKKSAGNPYVKQSSFVEPFKQRRCSCTKRPHDGPKSCKTREDHKQPGRERLH